MTPAPKPSAKARKNYYVDNGGQWFIVGCQNMKRARSVGVEEFGRGNVGTVRRATQAECEEYLSWKSLTEIPLDQDS